MKIKKYEKKRQSDVVCNTLMCSDVVDFLVQDAIGSKKNVVIKQTNSTTQINSNLYSTSEFYFSKKHFCLMSKIKSEIRKNYSEKHENLANIFGGGMRVFDYSLTDIEHKECVEVDLNSAYIRSAYLLGLISAVTFEKCSDLPKQARLRILGSIATKKEIFIYENGILVEQDIKQDSLMFNAWKSVVNFTYLNMLDIQKDTSTILFWVDAFFVSNKNDVPKICKNIVEKEYTYKVKNIEYMKYGYDNGFFALTVKKENEDETFIPLPESFGNYVF